MTQNKQNFNTMLAALTILPYIVPNGLQSFSFMSAVYRLKYMSFIIIFLLIFGNGKIKKSVNRLDLSIVVFALVMIAITMIQSTNTFDAITRLFNMIFPVMWIDYMLKKSERRVLRFFISYYGILSIINLAIIIINPSGIVITQSSNKTFLLGIDNKMIFTLLPLLGIALFYIDRYLEWKHRTRHEIIAVLVFSSSLIVAWAANGMMAIMIMLLLLFIDGKSNRKYFTLLNGLIAVTIICFLVIFSTFFSQGIFADFIIDVLHKDVTFSGRAVLWGQTLTLVYQSPLIGYGVGTDVSNSFYFWSKGEIISGFSTHNGYLRILLEGGIVSLVAYAMIYIVLYRSSKAMWDFDRGIRILTYCTIGMLLTFVFEAEFYSTPFLFVLGMIYYYSKNFDKEARNA